ncbi:uncharacterized protein [Typha angustifolia]|uniref:uncharacterized protein n=1 Tax=Typha angustifolia TaxID=59011 RepID=UPI003C2BA348
MAGGEFPPTVAKLSISSATLASLLQLSSSAAGDSDGLLFGHFSLLPPPDPIDDENPSPSPPSSSASITSLLFSGSPMSFYDPLGRINPSSPVLLRSAGAGGHLIGWFSSRRRSPLRPSMRELAVSQTLALTLDPRPRVFLLVSSSLSPNRSIHSHDYRAFILMPNGSLEPRSLDVINVGPAFREKYGSFSPESALPWMPCGLRKGGEEGEGERRNKRRESLGSPRKAAGPAEQRLLDASAEGFGIERLGQMVGPGAAEYTAELEELYGKTLVKLEGLARLVEKSSARVLEQENRNLLLRSKLAGLE